MAQPPVVRLYRNPWAASLTDGVVLQLLVTAATQAQSKLDRMIAAGDVEDGRDSYTVVLLDPTRPRWATTLHDRVFAVIGLGPNWQRYLPNAAAKADAHDRHGVANVILVDARSHCLGDDDFAWGNSAEYLGAIAGGSGLSPEQDGDMALDVLTSVMGSVRTRRDRWLAQMRGPDGSHRWYNRADQPGSEYLALLNRRDYVSPAVA